MSGKLLRDLYTNQTMYLHATRGTGTFANSTDVYTGFLDPDFERLKLNGLGRPSDRNEVGMKEMRSSGTFAKIFAEIGDIGSLCFPQEQAKNFGREHPEKLHPIMYIRMVANSEPASTFSRTVMYGVVNKGLALYTGSNILTSSCFFNSRLKSRSKETAFHFNTFVSLSLVF